jgi:hypothetical protein
MAPKKQIQIISKVKEYCDKHNINKNQFIAKCISSPITTETGTALTIDTASRIFDGDTGIRLATAGLVASVFEVDISELFTIK